LSWSTRSVTTWICFPRYADCVTVTADHHL